MPEPQQKPQADPWEAAAQAYKQGGGQAASPENSSADWKLWTQNGTADDSERGPVQRLQKSFDENTGYNANDPLLKKVLAGTARAIGEPFVHPVDAAKGFAKSLDFSQIDKQPVQPYSDTLKQLPYDLGETFGGVSLGAAAEAVPGAAKGAWDMVPTRAKAGQLFDNVMTAAKDEPVVLKRAMPHLERTQQLASAGATPLRPADLLYQRINTVNDLPYSEARDFASNLSRMSAAERMATNPQMAREARLLSHSLNDDIGEAADRAGVGDDYRKAMSTYAKAARNAEMAKTVGKTAITAAKYALPAGAGYEVLKRAFK